MNRLQELVGATIEAIDAEESVSALMLRRGGGRDYEGARMLLTFADGRTLDICAYDDYDRGVLEATIEGPALASLARP